MGPPERFPPDDPREWLNRARSNLARAKTLVPDTYFEDACFEAQQAAEKAIKAVMMSRDIEFPYVHDLGRLLLLLAKAGEKVPESVLDADLLTQYAWTSRYPFAAAPVSEDEYRKAVEQAEVVVRWAELQV